MSGTTTATQQSWVERAKRSTVPTRSSTQSRTGCQPSTAGSPWSPSGHDRWTSRRGRSSLEALATRPPPPTQAPSTRLQASVAMLPSSPTDPPSLGRLDHPQWSTSHQSQEEEEQVEEVWDVGHRVVRLRAGQTAKLSRRPDRGRWRRWWEVEATSSGGRGQCKPESTTATLTLSSGTTGSSMDGYSARIFSPYGKDEYLDWIFLLFVPLLRLDPCVFVALIVSMCTGCDIYLLWYWIDKLNWYQNVIFTHLDDFIRNLCRFNPAFCNFVEISLTIDFSPVRSYVNLLSLIICDLLKQK